MIARCPWWIAWWHRRRRRIDRATIWRALRAGALRAHPHDEEAALVVALRGWALFMQDQAHWQCGCAPSAELEP